MDGSHTLRVQPIIFTGRIALWRDLLETIGLRRESGDDVFTVYRGEAGSVALHAAHESPGLPEGTVKLAWTVPGLEAFRRDADAAGLATRLARQAFGDELRVEVPDLGWVTVTEGAVGRVADDGNPGAPSLRVLARVNAIEVDAVRQGLEALGWEPRFWAVDATYAELSSDGLMAVSRREAPLPTVGRDATAILALETDTPRTECDRLADEGLDVSLTEQSWGWSVSVPTPSDWVLRLVQPPLDDPAYEYADPQEQAAADEVASDR